MSTPTKVSSTGAAVLHAAADHPEGRATPPEYLPTAARNAVMVSLLRAGLLEEVASGQARPGRRAVAASTAWLTRHRPTPRRVRTKRKLGRGEVTRVFIVAK